MTDVNDILNNATQWAKLTGVIDRNAYSLDSHEIWMCSMVDSTAASLEAMIGCVKRILAEYTQVEGEETYLNWAGGDYDIWNNVRITFTFAIMRMKSVQTEF